MRHSRAAGKKSDRNPLQPKRPRGKEVKCRIPREIVVSGRGFEENHRRARRRGRTSSDLSCHPPNAKVVSVTRNSASHVLTERFRHCYQLSSSSYPNRMSKSPATSRKRRLCSSLKCFFHVPVFPDRNVRDFFGCTDCSKICMASSRGVGIS